jgi:hypothetical protein
VVYQLEDAGHPALRLRASLRMVDGEGEPGYLYRVEAFSRLSGKKLGEAERLAPGGSQEEFAAASRQFQSAPFRAVVGELSAGLVDRYAAAEEAPDTPSPIGS